MITYGARAQIHLQAIQSNLAHISRELEGTDVCIVVKADAYGHGVENVLPLVMEAGFHIVGIANNSEAERVRAAGFTGRLIRVRAASPAEVAAVLGLGVEEWVGGFFHARALSELAVGEGASIPVHIALNSAGLSRECLDLGAVGGREELRALFSLTGLNIRGVCTHFPIEATEDTRRSAAQFERESKIALAELGTDRSQGVQLHCATSFAAFSVPESRRDMVRIGAAVYGDTSAAVSWQRSAMRLVAPVSSINLYPAGNTVGYGRTHALEGDTVIATVPIGYGDGVPRAVGGRGIALVRGKRVPIVEQLAMNSLAIDVTNVPGVRPGDEVVLYGSQGADTITSAVFEEHTQMIAAAAYASWGRVLPREVIPTPGYAS
ncbi:Broad specificity amino-acid racemase [Leucobacter aridicollis]|uniref:alanine racemase n=1 Tax=Leucobacter aridicollis TaxID=283878 RepID=UPI000EB37506|nr:alanine racemase [Leucobacter aridicollis]MCS3426847.1 alanine racemase [Leucobacter aridicollis]RKQ83756.1 alanine racemase [Mycolicibacterium mucogenicum 261Sha1.1M5]